MLLARHMTVAFIPSLFTIGTSGRAPGCCGGVLRWAAAPWWCGGVRRRVGGPGGVRKLSRHMPQTRFFTFVLRSSVMKAVFFSVLLILECDPHVHEHCHPEPHGSACRDRFGSSSVFNVAECSISFP